MSNEFLFSLQRDIENFETKYDRYLHLYANVAFMNTKKKTSKNHQRNADSEQFPMTTTANEDTTSSEQVEAAQVLTNMGDHENPNISSDLLCQGDSSVSSSSEDATLVHRATVGLKKTKPMLRTLRNRKALIPPSRYSPSTKSSSSVPIQRKRKQIESNPVGRSIRKCGLFKVYVNERTCDCCRDVFDTCYNFGETKVCSVCVSEKKVVVTDVNKFFHNKHSLKGCKICGKTLLGDEHSLGLISICTRCIVAGKCFCPTCTDYTPSQKKTLSNLWEHKKDYFDTRSGMDPRIETSKDEFSTFCSMTILPTVLVESLFKFTLSGQTVKNYDVKRDALRLNDLTVSYKSLLSFGQMLKSIRFIDGKKTINYKWYPAKGKKREFPDEVMKYVGRLHCSEDTQFFGIFTDLDALKSVLGRQFILFRSLESGVFTFKYIFFFINAQKRNGEEWNSYVVDLKKCEINCFSHIRNQHLEVLKIMNEVMEEEWKDLLISMEHEEIKSNYVEINFGSHVVMPLDIFSVEGTFRSDTGICAIFHVWVMTSEVLSKGMDIFELVKSENVERLRQLFLSFMISNDLNLLSRFHI